MEISDSNTPRMTRLDHLRREGLGFELEPYDHTATATASDGGGSKGHEFRPMNALDIMRETVRILRYNSASFMAVMALLICPVSAIVLSNVLVDQSVVKRLTIRLLLITRSSGVPIWPLVRNSCQRFVEMAVSSATCFPLYVTASLLAKAAVVYSVDCSYSRKQFDSLKFLALMSKIWKRLVVTYLWVSTVIVGCVTSFLLVLLAVSNFLLAIDVPQERIFYTAVATGIGFSVIYANVVILSSVAVVISVLEEVSGQEALLRSGRLISGQTQVGLVIFLLTTLGAAFVQGLFEHRVKTLSYGDGSSRLWEGPLLVLMNSFVVLIDSMMSAVFYYSCRSSSLEGLGGSGLGLDDGERKPILDGVVVGDESDGVQ